MSNYLGLSIYEPVNTDPAPAANPFDQPLNTTNAVQFSGVKSDYLRVGVPNGITLYGLPNTAPTDVGQTIVYKGDLGGQTVWDFPFDQNVNSGGSPSFQGLTVDTLTSFLVNAQGVLTVGGPGSEYALPLARGGAAGSLLVYNGAGGCNFSNPPSFGAFSYYHGLNTPDDASNLWVSGASPFTTYPLPRGVIDIEAGPLRLVEDTFLTTNQGFQFLGPSDWYEISVSISVSTSAANGEMLAFVGKTLPNLNMTAGPIDASMQALTSNNGGILYGVFSLSGTVFVQNLESLWVGLQTAAAGSTVHLRSMTFRARRIEV